MTLTAKDKICFNPDKACNGDACAFARGFYDRIDDALEELFRRDELTREVIESVAEAHHLCPFELSLELARWADLVVCDYNYVLDPRAYLRRLFDDGAGDYTFLIDEAHNLVDRARTCTPRSFESATCSPPGVWSKSAATGRSTCEEDGYSYVLPSPFPHDHLAVLVADRIATTYLLYFPSYEYMNAVYAIFEPRDADVLLQRPDMSELERAAFLAKFSAENERTLVGFAVSGGFFGEAIDLPGERLEGVAIVGVGLPGLSPERDRIRERFDRERGMGFEYAYLFPGMNRVLQAAGRVIRTEADRRVVLLVDERFAEARYRTLFPPEWSPAFVAGENALRRHLAMFWKGSPVVVA